MKNGRSKDSNYCKKLLENLDFLESQEPELIKNIKSKMRDSNLMKMHVVTRVKFILSNHCLAPEWALKLLFLFLIGKLFVGI